MNSPIGTFLLLLYSYKVPYRLNTIFEDQRMNETCGNAEVKSDISIFFYSDFEKEWRSFADQQKSFDLYFGLLYSAYLYSYE